MTISTILKTATFCLVLCLVLFTSCKVDKIEENLTKDAFALRNVSNCNLYFHGVVRDSKTGEVIPNAKVDLKEYGLKTLSDKEGNFTLKIAVPENEIRFWEGGKMIKVAKEGYVVNTLEIDFSQYFTPNDCGNFYATKIDADLLLTPESEPFLFQRNGGDVIVTVALPSTFSRTSPPVENEYIFWFPGIKEDGDNPPIKVTPIDINQTMGTMNQPLGAVFRFAAEPDGLTFTEPAMVKFKPVRTDIPTPAYYDDYVLNKETNRWERQVESYFTFMEDGTVILNYFHFSDHLITFRPGIVIETDTLRYRELASDLTANCNCRGPMLLKKELSFEDRVDESFEIETRINELPTRLMMADLRNILNIPTFAAELDNKFQNTGYTTKAGRLATLAEIMFDRELTLEGRADKCSIKTIMVREQIRDITGTMNGVPFKYNTVVAIDCGEVVARCPTSSNCHQGCPN